MAQVLDQRANLSQNRGVRDGLNTDI